MKILNRMLISVKCFFFQEKVFEINIKINDENFNDMRFFSNN
jgi:hypothetical protein